jgi:tetratricopeptide (TPR) repeat protein
MSRFGNLEFGEEKRAQEAEAPGAPVRDAPYFRARADKAFSEGDFELALRFYSRALEHNTAFFEGWRGQVLMLIELAEYREALLWVDKALALFPNHPELLAAKAVAAVRNGDFDRAMALTDDAQAQQGVTWRVWLARAEVLLERRSPSAIHCVSNAVALAGEEVPRARLEAGRLLLRHGRCPEALEHLMASAQLQPSCPLALLELGRCQSLLGFAAAEVTLAQCVALRPAWMPARRELDRCRHPGLWGRIRRLFRRKKA